MAGWLEKLGGAKGGSKTWQRRWCILAGSQLYYFVSPADSAEKGKIEITGCVASPGPSDDGAFSLSWGEGQPVREFRAEGGRAARERWIEAVKRVLRVERSKAGGQGAKLRAAAGTSAPPSFAASVEALETVRALGKPDAASLCFVLGNAAAATAPSCFVAGSMRDYDMWYTGLNLARDAALALSLAQRLERYTELSAASPHDAVVRVLLGSVLEEMGRAEEALPVYEAAVEAEPRLGSARRALGRFLLNIRRDAKAALPHLEIASALADREDFDATTLLGRAHTMIGNHAAAVPVLEHALILEPRSASAHVFIATSLAALSRLDDAIKHLRLSLLANPRQALVHAALGDLLTTQGRPEEALTHFNDALTHDPSLTTILEHVALALEALGRHREAVAYRERILEKDADNVDRILACAQAYYETEQARAHSLSAAVAAAQSRGAGRHRGSVADDGDQERYSPGGAEDDDGAAAGAGSFEEGDGEAGGGGATPAAQPQVAPPAAAAAAASGATASSLTPLAAPAFGSLPIDKQTSLELLTSAEAHLVRALTLRPESPSANILCAKVYERFAALERDALVIIGVPEGSSPNDEVYMSGWTPHQRLDSARNFYEYVVAAYPQPEYVEASINLAQLLVMQGAAPEALDVLREAAVRAPDNTVVAGLIKRLADATAGGAGADVVARPASKRRPGPAAPGEIDMTGVDMSLVVITPGMSEKERQHQFWLAMRATRAAEAEEKKRKEEARIASMTEEEREAHFAEKRKLAAHEEKQEKMIRNMGALYGSTAAASGVSSRILGASGKGRGGRGGRQARGSRLGTPGQQ